MRYCGDASLDHRPLPYGGPCSSATCPLQRPSLKRVTRGGCREPCPLFTFVPRLPSAYVSYGTAADVTKTFRPTARRSARSLGIPDPTFRALRDDLRGSGVDSAPDRCRDPSAADPETSQRKPREEAHKRGRVGVSATATRPDTELEDAVNATGGEGGEGDGRRLRGSTHISRKENAASPKDSLSPSSLGSECVDPMDFKEPVWEPTDPGLSLINRGSRADVDDLHGGRRGREQRASPTVSHLHGDEQEDETLDEASCQDAEALQDSPESTSVRTRPALTLPSERQRGESLHRESEGALQVGITQRQTTVARRAGHTASRNSFGSPVALDAANRWM